MIAVLVLLAGSAAAGTRPQYVVEAWNDRDGLPQNSVLSIVHSRDGFLWLATLGGLVRFDGDRFHVYRVSTHPGLGGNRIQFLLEDRAGSLWIGTENSGLSRRLSDGRFEHIPLCEQRCSVMALAEAEDGHIVATTSEGVYWLSPATGRRLHLVTLPEPWGSATVLYDHTQLGMLASGREVLFSVRMEITAAQPVTAPDDSNIRVIRAFGEHALVSTDGGVYRLDEHGRVRREALGDDPMPALSAMLRDSAGRDWLAPTTGGLMVRDADGIVDPVDELDGMALRALFEDREGNIWLGTNRNGLLRVTPAIVGASGRWDARLDRSVLPIISDGKGGIYVGAACGGLAHLAADGSVNVNVPGIESDACIWSLWRDPDDTLWVGLITGGLVRLENGRPEPMVDMDGRPGEFSVRALFRDQGGTLWIGTTDGLRRLDGNKAVPLRSTRGYGIMHIAEFEPGRLWLGTSNGLMELAGDTFQRVAGTAALTGPQVRALHRDSAGVTWIGTYGDGLWRLDGDDLFHITEAHGLFEDVISCILEDDRGRLWMSGNRGIFFASRDDLNELHAGAMEQIGTPAITSKDGMLISETNGGGQPACHRDGQGRLWYPTLAGAVTLDPEHLSLQLTPPALHIESVRLEGQLRSIDSAGLVLPANTRNLEVNYTATHFTAPHRLRFRYRLEGLDQSWVHAGQRRAAYYSSLPSGRHQFQVQVGTDSGQWFEQTAMVDLIVQPRLLEQPGFYALAAAGLLLITILATGARIRHLRQRELLLNRQIAERTEELRRANQALTRLAQVDELTGIANYRKLWLYLRHAWQQCRESGEPLALIVMDIDHFKAYNDSLGHQAGDEALRRLARRLHIVVRESGGLMARYGGEEFVAVIPGAETGRGVAIAERMRLALEQLHIRHPKSGRMTASFGVCAEPPREGLRPEDLITAADRALYLAKHRGRNRVQSMPAQGNGPATTGGGEDPPAG